MSEEQRTVIKFAIENKAVFQVEYVDSPEAWTLPVLLTEERAKWLEDHSIKSVRISFNFEPNIL